MDPLRPLQKQEASDERQLHNGGKDDTQETEKRHGGTGENEQ